MADIANILRGKKWSEERAKAVFENRKSDVAFFDNQQSIVNDIKAYEESILNVGEEEQTKSKGKK